MADAKKVITIDLNLDDRAARAKLKGISDQVDDVQKKARQPQGWAALRQMGREQLAKDKAHELFRGLGQAVAQQTAAQTGTPGGKPAFDAHAAAIGRLKRMFDKAALENELDRLLGREPPEVKRVGPKPKELGFLQNLFGPSRFGKAAAGVVGGAIGGGLAGGAGESGLGGIAGGLAGLAGAAGPAALAIGAIVVKAKELVGVGLEFAKLALPAAAMRYRFAVEDTQAVIGRVFVPVLELMTKSVRLIGDTLATILPTTDEVRSALSSLGDALKELRPQIALLANALKIVSINSTQMVGVILESATKLSEAVVPLKKIAELFGFDLKSSVGAAPRAASTTGVEEYLKSVRQAAFMSGNATAAEATAKNTADTAGWVKAIAKYLLAAGAVPFERPGNRRALDGFG